MTGYEYEVLPGTAPFIHQFIVLVAQGVILAGGIHIDLQVALQGRPAMCNEPGTQAVVITHFIALVTMGQEYAEFPVTGLTL